MERILCQREGLKRLEWHGADVSESKGNMPSVGFCLKKEENQSYRISFLRVLTDREQNLQNSDGNCS